MTHQSAADWLAGEGLDEAALVALINSQGRTSYALTELLAMGDLHGAGLEWSTHPRNGWYSSVELVGAPDWAIRVFDALDQSIKDQLAEEQTDKRRNDVSRQAARARTI